MKAGYIYCKRLSDLADEATPPAGRSSRVHALIQALGLVGNGSSLASALSYKKTASAIIPSKAHINDLQRFHSAAFLNAALNAASGSSTTKHSDTDTSSGTDEDDSDDSDSSSSRASSSFNRVRKRQRRRSGDRYGLTAEPPAPDYILGIAGSSLSAARHLCVPSVGGGTDISDLQETLESGEATPYDIIFNWEGGRHHAMRDKAAGFCYVQDVGLAIDLLRRQGCVRVLEAAEEEGGTAIERFQYLPQTRTRRPRIMYLDLDIHFGDGVASACRHPYRYSNPATAQQLKGPKPSVLTLSLHHYARGFFPANPEGGMTPIETPTPFNLSIPLNAGVSSPTYARLMSTCVEPIKDAFDPDYIVLLLGMDALHGDHLVDGAGNWSLDGEGGVAWVCDRITSWNCRTLVLGGGGYDRLNTAKGWACATSVFVGNGFDPDGSVPEHEYWPEYGPDFGLDVAAGNVKDQNDEAHLREIEKASERWVERISAIMR